MTSLPATRPGSCKWHIGPKNANRLIIIEAIDDFVILL